MTAKEYLSQAKYLDMRIQSKIQQVYSLNDLATSATSVLSDMPHSPNKASSKLEDVICKIIDLQEEINHDIDRLVNLKQEIVTVIKTIDNVEYQILLEKRYLCCLSWEKIAVDMGYNTRHIFKMHALALEECKIPQN